MARRLTSTSSELIQFLTAGQHFTNWGFGTLALYARKATDTGAWQYIMCNNNAANNDTGFGWSLDPTDHLNIWSTTGANDRASTTTFKAADGWCVVAFTKTTGGTPRAHFYKHATKTWTHENTGGTQADNTSVNASPKVTIGAFSHSTTGDYFNGDIAAIMALNQYVMTDSEIERLPEGLWDRWVTRADDFLIEFPSGRDPFVAGVNTVRSRGRASMQATTTTGTSRTAAGDPSGFRFSRFKRRR